MDSILKITKKLSIILFFCGFVFILQIRNSKATSSLCYYDIVLRQFKCNEHSEIIINNSSSPSVLNNTNLIINDTIGYYDSIIDFNSNVANALIINAGTMKSNINPINISNSSNNVIINQNTGILGNMIPGGEADYGIISSLSVNNLIKNSGVIDGISLNYNSNYNRIINESTGEIKGGKAGFYSIFSNNNIANSGLIKGVASGIALDFSLYNKVINKKNASIYGMSDYSSGISLYISRYNDITNYGDLFGNLYGIVFDVDSSSNTLTNYGTISSNVDAGIVLYSSNDNKIINTSTGIIKSRDSYGIKSLASTSVIIENLGTIYGDVLLDSETNQYWFDPNTAKVLNNTGTGIGLVKAGDGTNDIIGLMGTYTVDPYFFSKINDRVNYAGFENLLFIKTLQ